MTYTPKNPNGYTTRDGRAVTVHGPDEEGYLWGEVTNPSGRKIARLWHLRTGRHCPSVTRPYERETDLVNALAPDGKAVAA